MPRSDTEDRGTIYIRRLRDEELAELDQDLLSLLPNEPQQCELFCVAPNKTR